MFFEDTKIMVNLHSILDKNWSYNTTNLNSMLCHDIYIWWCTGGYTISGGCGFSVAYIPYTLQACRISL